MGYVSIFTHKWFQMAYRKEINKIDLAKYKEDSKKALILEVDLEYPQELYDLHNGYLLAPQKIKITKKSLSPYC